MIGIMLGIFAMISKKIRPLLFMSGMVGVGVYFGFKFMGTRTLERFETLKDVKMIQARTVGTAAGMFSNYMEKYRIVIVQFQLFGAAFDKVSFNLVSKVSVIC